MALLYRRTACAGVGRLRIDATTPRANRERRTACITAPLRGKKTTRRPVAPRRRRARPARPLYGPARLAPYQLRRAGGRSFTQSVEKPSLSSLTGVGGTNAGLNRPAARRGQTPFLDWREY